MHAEDFIWITDYIIAQTHTRFNRIIIEKKNIDLYMHSIHIHIYKDLNALRNNTAFFLWMDESNKI